LPLSTLACPPSGNYLKQYINSSKDNATTSSKVDKDKGIGFDSGTGFSIDPKLSGIQNINNKKQSLVQQNNSKSNIQQTSTNTNLKNGKQEVFVKKWVDYSSKYGLGYLLSNGSSGVFFNDCTKMVVDPEKNYFEYMERKDRVDIVNAYNLNSYPKDLHKKVTLLQHFRSYLEGIRTQPTNPTDNAQPIAENKPNLIYLKKWMKTRHAIMFRLSNKIVQVDFQDKTQIVLSSESKLVTYVNKKGEGSQYPIATALESDNAEMAKRLKYTKEILTHMLNNNQQNAQNTANPTK